MSDKNRKIVLVNQASNYLTVGFCNAFAEEFNSVSLITGSIHLQGEELNPSIKVNYINKWKEKPAWRKLVSYVLGCLRILFLLKTKYRKHEVLFISLPPMAYMLNLLVKNRFSMIIWDVYPDVFKITGMTESHKLYRIWSKLNRKSFAKAYRLYTISEKMADLIEKYVDRKKIIVLPIWSIFQDHARVEKLQNPFLSKHNLQDKFIVQYSGNIGLTHRVELLVELARIMNDETNILFQIIGRGPRVDILKETVRSNNLNNCSFLPFQDDDMFIYSLSAADLGVVILDERTSKGSVPSKSYNLMNLGIPSLYFAAEDSELNNYTNKFNHGKCFSEAELEKAKSFVIELSQNKEYWKELSQNSKLASKSFKRKNANVFVEKYNS